MVVNIFHCGMLSRNSGIGYGQTYAVGMCATYYASLIALTMRFFIASFQPTLPWSYCKEEWGNNCIDSSLNSSAQSTSTGNTSSSEFYF